MKKLMRLTDTQVAAFRRDGFVRIDALTDAAEIEDLLGSYDEMSVAEERMSK